LIPSYPTTNDHPRPQAVGAGQPGSSRSGLSLVSVPEESFSFSQLLSGKMALARSVRSEPEDKLLTDMSAKESGAADQEKIKTESTGSETKAPGGQTQSAHSTTSDTNQTTKPQVLEGGMLVGALSAWVGFAGLYQLGEPVGLAGPTVVGMLAGDGLPPATVVGLAADIAAGYAEKNGVQTLTVNLEPEHLGRVEVRLLATGDHLSVRLIAANPEAATAMRDNLKDLTEAILTRTGRFQHLDVRVELRESHDPDPDPGEKERPGFQGQDSPTEQGANPETENDSSANPDNQVDTEPGQRAQEG
jgi:flagellar hook-length control protein FliK